MKRLVLLLAATVFGLMPDQSAAIGPSCTQLVIEHRVAAIDLFTALQEQATPFRNIFEVPGLPGGLPEGLQGRFLRTKDIPAQLLPQQSAVLDRSRRSPRTALDPDAIPKVKIAQETDVYLVSEDHSGSTAGVYLGRLDGGRVVAVKAFDPKREFVVSLKEMIFKEAQAATIVSDLGLGPQFHGFTIDSRGRPALVYDIAVGDFVNMPVTTRSFEHLETIFRRLERFGLSLSGDFQVYRGWEGELAIIDPGSVVAGSHPNNRREQNYQRILLLASAEPALALRYLRELQRQKPEVIPLLKQQVQESLANPYFSQRGGLLHLQGWASEN